MKQLSNTELVREALGGNMEALGEIYERTYKKAYITAVSVIANRTDAEDAVQDAYVRAFEHLDTLREPEKLQTWVNQIIANRCRDYNKKKHPHLFSELADEGEDAAFVENLEEDRTQYRPAEQLDYRETEEIIRKLLGSIPADQRLIIVLYYYDEMTTQEIAAALEIPEGTVKSRLRYAKSKLKKEAAIYEKANDTVLRGVGVLPFLVWFLGEAAEHMETAGGAAKAAVLARMAAPQMAGETLEAAQAVLEATTQTATEAAAETTTQTATEAAAETATQTAAEAPIERKHRRSRLRRMLMAVAAAAMVFTVLGGGAYAYTKQQARTIDLDDYITYSVTGYDGDGRASVRIDYDKMIKDMRLAAKKADGEADKQAREEQIAALGASVEAHAAPAERLSIGDTVEVTVIFDTDLAEAAGIRLHASDFTFTVEEA